MFLIESAVLAAEILPEVGGKIGQIRYKRLGRDVLVPPQRAYATIPDDKSWLDYDTSGMDDCFPNVAAGQYPGGPEHSLSLPDLGEWTHGAWDVLDAMPTTIRMRRQGYRLPYTAYKRVRFADDHTLEFSYRVENRTSFPIRYLWSAHPLIRVEESYQLVVPGDGLCFRTFPPDGDLHPRPHWDGADLSRQWIPRGRNLKVFVTALREGWCALQLPEYAIRMTFSLAITPVLGIWFNHDGFSSGGAPFRCIALEPCTSPSDLLDDLEESAYPTIAAGGSAEWSMRLEITAPPAA